MGNLKTFSDYALNEPEQSWLIDNLFSAGGTSLLVGDPKSGKSQLVRHLIYSCLYGTDFLNCSVNEKRSVLYLALEETPTELKKYLLSIGVDAAAQNLLIGDRTWSEGNNMKELSDDIAKHNPSLCVIDTFVAFSDLTDLNDYAKVYKPLQEIAGLARKQNCHILIVHHKNKSEATGAKGIMGSTAFFGAVDTCLLLSGENNQKVLAVQPRYTEKHDIKFNMTPAEITDVEQNKKGVSCKEALLEKISKADKGFNFRQFAGYSKQTAQDAKKSLLDEGRIFQEGGKSGDPTKLFLTSISPS